MKKIFITIFLCIIFTYNADANWEYSENRGSVFTVYKTKDDSGSPVYLSLEVSKESVTIQALISLQEYKKYFTFNPQPIFIVDGTKLVKNEYFFWGQDGQQIKVNIDQNTFGGFSRSNGYQIMIKGPVVSKVVNAIKMGSILKLDHHYWSQEKLYPTFSLVGFTEVYNRFFKAIENGVEKEIFSVSGLHCFTTGAKEFVWIKTNQAIYALNGPGMDFFDLLDKKAIKGFPRRKGRDYLDNKILKGLIEKGLLLCK